jgi:acetoin utilization protein AcuB
VTLNFLLRLILYILYGNFSIGEKMRVSELMSTKLITVELDDKLSVVKEIFDNMRIHHLLVVELQKVFGVVSDRDLYKALSPNIGMAIETSKDAATLNKRVHQIVSRHPIVLTGDADIEEAIKIFNTHAISCIPIVGYEMKPLGILTVRDILKALGNNKITFPT